MKKKLMYIICLYVCMCSMAGCQKNEDDANVSPTDIVIECPISAPVETEQPIETEVLLETEQPIETEIADATQSEAAIAEYKDLLDRLTVETVQNIRLIIGGAPAFAEQKTLTRQEDISYILEKLHGVTIIRELMEWEHRYTGGIGFNIVIALPDETVKIVTDGDENGCEVLSYNGHRFLMEQGYPYDPDPDNGLSHEEYEFNKFDYEIEEVNIQDIT